MAASIALCVAVLGHLAGGGTAPGAASLAVAAAVAAALSYRIAGARWTPRTLTALVLALQGGVHLWCALTVPAGAPVSDVAPGWAMLLGHAAATLATVTVLLHGEAALGGLAEQIVVRPVRRLAYAVGASAPAAAVPLSRVELAVVGARALRRLLRAGALRRRGPPVCA